MVLRQSPTGGGGYSGFHVEPPRPNLLKYLGGPESGCGNSLSDTAPEGEAAADAHHEQVGRAV
jgi:UDPglucose--hexose-1-phosphate uridylyltransferase